MTLRHIISNIVISSIKIFFLKLSNDLVISINVFFRRRQVKEDSSTNLFGNSLKGETLTKSCSVFVLKST